MLLPQACGGMAFGVTGETNTLSLISRGPWVCISPWNFPLAVFMGQVAAALATGNAARLRLLVLHEAIAGNVIEMIQGAAAELS